VFVFQVAERIVHTTIFCRKPVLIFPFAPFLLPLHPITQQPSKSSIQLAAQLECGNQSWLKVCRKDRFGSGWLRWEIFGSCGGSVGKYLAPAAPLANLAPSGEPPASSAPLVNLAPLANSALSAQWFDKRRAHEQQKQTTTRTTMGDRLTYFGVDDAKGEKRKLHIGRLIIIMKEGRGGRNNK
jgi:hypothetical protein